MKNYSHFVVIEADGNQLPNWYYNRRRELAFKVRGDKEQSPLARRVSRATADGSELGVIMQEGMIITASESFARQIAHLTQLAFDDLDERDELTGQPFVQIGTLELQEGFSMTRQDHQIAERIQRVMGKKGRRPKAKNWAVSCSECCTVTTLEHHSPVNCPNCGGFLIKNRPGKANVFGKPAGQDVAELWLNTRFNGPHWEPARIVTDADDMPIAPAVDVNDLQESDEITKFLGSDVIDTIRTHMDDETAVEFMDAIFISRSQFNTETRLQSRLTTATQFFARGGQPTDINLTEPEAPDLVDAASVLPVDVVVDWLMVINSK